MEVGNGIEGSKRTEESDSKPMLVGVLTVSHPTLNDRWRERAWPGVFEIADKRERAHALNATVRRISRVVVLPRFRGMGIATALVRAYLRRPLTVRTEVVAAMGDLCRCFERAGMRAVECEAIARDIALAKALNRMRIAPESLADERVVQNLLSNEGFVKAIRAWANAAGGTRKVLRCAGAVERLAPSAARAVVSIGDGGRVWVSERVRANGSGGENAENAEWRSLRSGAERMMREVRRGRREARVRA